MYGGRSPSGAASSGAAQQLMRLTNLYITALGTLLGPKLQVSLNDGVEIQLSSGKGLGVFATRDLPAGAYLGRYTGRLLSAKDAFAAYDRGDTSGNYFAALQGAPGAEPLVLDAEDFEISGWPRFINHSLRQQNCKNTELRLPLWGSDFRLPLGLYVQTTRDIAAGEELYVDYGAEYWTDRGVPRYSPRRFVIDYL